MKYKETAVILEQREISEQIYSLWLHADDIVREARPGQFVSVYCRDESRLLPPGPSVSASWTRRAEGFAWCTGPWERAHRNFPPMARGRRWS